MYTKWLLLENFILQNHSKIGMNKEIMYPSVEKIIEYNILALASLKVKKADKAEVLSRKKIMDIIETCQQHQGEVYHKAVLLLKGIVRMHPFASGNRRTAFIVAKDFVLSNSERFKIRDDPIHAKVMQGIRENYYSNEEIKEWIKNGKIREFKR